MKSKKKKALERRREEILITMPTFINQLLLLMNSGMVMQDAFKKIAQGYGKLEGKQQNYFTREVWRVYESGEHSGESVITLFYRFSRVANVKELTRVANIMMENQSKGTDLWYKLAEEGERLWQERKRLALERIRIAESKMSFPLGLLLLSLLLVTAAPALMQM